MDRCFLADLLVKVKLPQSCQTGTVVNQQMHMAQYIRVHHSRTDFPSSPNKDEAVTAGCFELHNMCMRAVVVLLAITSLARGDQFTRSNFRQVNQVSKDFKMRGDIDIDHI